MGLGTRGLSIREKAYLHIQQQIANGRLRAGSGISELSLAKELGSSRSPIREAMNQLAAEGLLEQNSGGGLLVNLNDNCVISFVPIPLFVCVPGKKPANGDLFKHMRDP